MPEIIGLGQISLLDLNDAIIAGVPPTNPSVGTLWIDDSLDPPMLKKWNGDIWVDVGELDPDLSETIESIMSTLGNMANDNVIDFKERQVIKDKLTDIIGYVIADTDTTLPTTATLDSSAKGGFYTVRKSALNAGIPSNNSTYVNVATRYNNLKSYLEALSPIDAWDLRTANKDVVINVTKSTFRDRWLQYYLAVDALATLTAQKLKENVDNIDVGGRNRIKNSVLPVRTHGDNAFRVEKDVETPFGVYEEIGVFTTTSDNVGSSLIRVDNLLTAEDNGKDFTFSVYAKTVNTGDVANISLDIADHPSKAHDVGNEWVQISVTSSITWVDSSYMFVDIGIRTKDVPVYLAFWKLERGNKPTDWTLAPEDTERNIADLTGRVDDVEFEISGDRIVQKVTSSEKWAQEINVINQNISNAVDGLDISVRNYIIHDLIMGFVNPSYGDDTKGRWYEFNTTVKDITKEDVFEANTQYTLSFELQDITSLNTRLRISYTDGTFNDLFSGKHEFTTPSDKTVKKIFITYGSSGRAKLYNPMFVRGSKAMDYLPAPEDTQNQLDSIKGLKKVRYIRDWLNGSSANTSNHWVEIQAITRDGVNIALGKTVTASASGSNLNLITDGNTSSESYATVVSGSLQWVRVDLGDVYDNIDFVKVWHYYADGRAYNNTKTEVSEDGVNWITIFDSAIDDVYAETADGAIHIVNANVADNLGEVGSTIQLLKTQMNNVEQTITSEGISTVISESVFYENLMETLDEKVDTGALGDFATKDELGELEEGLGQTIDTKIAGINFEPYATKLELEETSKNITAKFSATGGMNLIKNSIGYAGKEFWIDNASISTIQNNELDTLGFGSGFMVKHNSSFASIYQVIPVVPNKSYTLSWYENLSRVDSGGYAIMRVHDGETTNDPQIMSVQTNSVTDGFQFRHRTFVPTGNTIRIRMGGHLSEIIFTGLMLTIGDVPLQWSLSTGEMYNTNVRMDIKGIRVSQIDSNRKEIGFTQITPEEFAGYTVYYDSNGNAQYEKVFYLNGDETVTKKFRALEEITMGSVKIVTINKSGNNGWAFVPN